MSTTTESSSDSLIGAFLASLPDLLDNLRHAAKTPLPAPAITLFATSTATPPDLVHAFANESSTARGFWRVALASLLYARQQHIDISDLPSGIADNYDDLFRAVKESQPQVLGRSDFLSYCYSLLLKFASEPDERGDDSPDAGNDIRSAPRVVSSSGGLPSIRYTEAGFASACSTYSLVDDKGEVFLLEELAVEDMLFIAHSAITSASRSLAAAQQVVKEGLLQRHLDDDALKWRSEAIKTDLDDFLEVLRMLPVAERARKA